LHTQTPTHCYASHIQVWAAGDMYNKFDTDGNGELSLHETVTLLNSADYRGKLQETLGVDVPERTAEDIKALFHKLDADNRCDRKWRRETAA
jgi:Ca2+-binding EF-hand superfamily protein